VLFGLDLGARHSKILKNALRADAQHDRLPYLFGKQGIIGMEFIAYIDPGAGLLIWQAVVSAVIGLLFYLKKTREFLFAFFRRIFGRNKPE
jgi:hypothetical protein